jgi:hypothetical protein
MPNERAIARASECLGRALDKIRANPCREIVANFNKNKTISRPHAANKPSVSRKLMKSVLGVGELGLQEQSAFGQAKEAIRNGIARAASLFILQAWLGKERAPRVAALKLLEDLSLIGPAPGR